MAKTKTRSFKIYSKADILENSHSVKPTPTGNGFEWIFREKRDPDTGEYIVYAAEMKCLNDEIQAAYDDTKIYNILSRVTQTDMTALNRRQGMYADISNMPTSVFEMEDQIGHLKRMYKMADCADKFTFSEFMELAGTSDFREYFKNKFERQNAQSGEADRKTAIVQNDEGGSN